MINGSVNIGSGYATTLVVGYNGTSTPVTGITGTITTTGTFNTQQLQFNSDTVIDTPVDLLTGFNHFAILTGTGATTTLAQGFAPPAVVEVRGAGTLLNQGLIVSSGTAFSLQGLSIFNGTTSDTQTFINDGTIQITQPSATAIVAPTNSQVINNGTITSAGSGIFSGGPLTNTGTINADSVGVVMRDLNSNSGSLTNSGTIRSNYSTGAVLQSGYNASHTNSGTIVGSVAGVLNSDTLTNTGTILTTNPAGTAVQLSGIIYNNAGGIVGNGGQAIEPRRVCRRLFGLRHAAIGRCSIMA